MQLHSERDHAIKERDAALGVSRAAELEIALGEIEKLKRTLASAQKELEVSNMRTHQQVHDVEVAALLERDALLKQQRFDLFFQCSVFSVFCHSLVFFTYISLHIRAMVEQQRLLWAEERVKLVSEAAAELEVSNTAD